MTWAAIQDALAWPILALATLSFVTVLVRNFICVAQLAVASHAFATRIRPSQRALDLWSRNGDIAPSVSVIAPAFNESLSIVDSVRALLAIEYPDFEVIVVNDGSTDDTLAILMETFGMAPVSREQSAALQVNGVKGSYASALHPRLLVIDKANGRKADAANAGIGFAEKDLVCIIDADSILEPDGLLRATEPFMGDDGTLVAVGGAIRIANGCRVRGGHVVDVGIPRGLLPRFQIIEYLRAFLTARVAMSRLGMLTLISGAFGIFKRTTVIDMGGYRHDTVGEDLELMIRMHRHLRDRGEPYRMDFVPEVVCWTEAPATMGGLRNQRARWQQGALETLRWHRGMLFRKRYGRIGSVAMPLMILEDIIGPPAELIGYLIFPIGAALGILSPASALAFLSLSFAFGTAISIAVLVLEERQIRRTPNARGLARIARAAVLENFGYRQINLVFRFLGVWRFLRGDSRWAAVPRFGFDQA